MSAPRDKDLPRPGEDTFSEDDLIPSHPAPAAASARQRRLHQLDRLAGAVAVIALGVWSGGMLALGACAAPMVFQLTPFPFSGQAMGAAFARFDRIAIGCAVVALGCEVVRTWLGRRSGAWLPRVRRYLTILLAVGAVYSATQLTPMIMQLHQQGVRRRVGPEGEDLERIHRHAEWIGKITVPSAMLLMALHVFAVPSRDDDEDDEVVAPRPPGR